jgi:hypothetical protein
LLAKQVVAHATGEQIRSSDVLGKKALQGRGLQGSQIVRTPESYPLIAKINTRTESEHTTLIRRSTLELKPPSSMNRGHGAP